MRGSTWLPGVVKQTRPWSGYEIPEVTVAYVTGLLGFGLLALACLALFTLLAGALFYVAAFGDPDTKRWKAFAAPRGWECDGPWRLRGGPPTARWTLGADYDDDRGTGTISWQRDDVPASTPHLLVVRRVDYDRYRAQLLPASSASRLAAVALDMAAAAVAVASNAAGSHAGGSLSIGGNHALPDGLRDAGAGGPNFRRHWVVLSEAERTGRAFLDAEAEAAWLAALEAMPQMFANGDVMFEARPPHIRLRAEGARHRPPLDEVEVFVRLGLALTTRATDPSVGFVGITPAKSAVVR